MVSDYMGEKLVLLLRLENGRGDSFCDGFLVFTFEFSFDDKANIFMGTEVELFHL